MCTINNTSNMKQPFKLLEIPLNKFKNEAVPHQENLFELHKSTVKKLVAVNNTEQLKRQIRNKQNVIPQLKMLMYELDTLRTQVYDSDLDRFDMQTVSLRKTIINLIAGYAEMNKYAMQCIDTYDEENKPEKNEHPLYGAAQIQIQETLDDLKLREREQTLQKVEELHQDIEDLHGMYGELNDMVYEQKESVDAIETHTETAQINVTAGLQQLITASRLKKATYPLTGALVGSCVGGPIGLIAGFKIGGLAALGCGLIGYTGGKIFKGTNVNNSESVNTNSTDNSGIINTDGKVEPHHVSAAVTIT